MQNQSVVVGDVSLFTFVIHIRNLSFVKPPHAISSCGFKH